MEEKLAVSLQEALQEGDTRALREVLEEIHPQDLLALWDELKGEHRYVVLTLLPKAKAPRSSPTSPRRSRRST